MCECVVRVQSRWGHCCGARTARRWAARAAAAASAPRPRRALRARPAPPGPSTTSACSRPTTSRYPPPTHTPHTHAEAAASAPRPTPLKYHSYIVQHLNNAVIRVIHLNVEKHLKLSSRQMLMRSHGMHSAECADVGCVAQVRTLTGEGGHLRRDVTLAQHRDFELVPDALWRALAAWYGAPAPLPRQVTPAYYFLILINVERQIHLATALKRKKKPPL